MLAIMGIVTLKDRTCVCVECTVPAELPWDAPVVELQCILTKLPESETSNLFFDDGSGRLRRVAGIER